VKLRLSAKRKSTACREDGKDGVGIHRPGLNGSKDLGRTDQRTLEERIKGPGKNGSKDLEE